MKTLLKLFALCVLAIGASAQVTNTPTIKLKQPKEKIDVFKGEVVNCTPAAITVRDPADIAKIRTFTYTPELTRKMENRYYENASRVTVKYRHLTDTVVALKGKLLTR